MTPEQIRALKTPELVALYNRLTGKSIKKFASRAAGEKQTIKAQASSSPPAVPALPQGTVRTVRGSSTGGKNGRPKSKYIVQLTEDKAKSKPQKASDRHALIEWLKSKGAIHHGGEELSHAASIDSIEAHFNKRMRGVVQKLLEKHWLRRIETA